jgi:hypothetical protein
MTLTGDQMAVLLAGARSVPDLARDNFFKMVADALRGEERHRNQDVKRAVTAARYKFGGLIESEQGQRQTSRITPDDSNDIQTAVGEDIIIGIRAIRADQAGTVRDLEHGPAPGRRRVTQGKAQRSASQRVTPSISGT